jgi:hypothetical protein
MCFRTGNGKVRAQLEQVVPEFGGDIFSDVETFFLFGSDQHGGGHEKKDNTIHDGRSRVEDGEERICPLQRH